MLPSPNTRDWLAAYSSQDFAGRKVSIGIFSGKRPRTSPLPQYRDSANQGGYAEPSDIDERELDAAVSILGITDSRKSARREFGESTRSSVIRAPFFSAMFLTVGQAILTPRYGQIDSSFQSAAASATSTSQTPTSRSASNNSWTSKVPSSSWRAAQTP
jgi:hypothetical protein